MTQNILEIIPRGEQHFDVYVNRERRYCIRGGKHDTMDFLIVRLENQKYPCTPPTCKTVTAALTWIIDQEFA